MNTVLVAEIMSGWLPASGALLTAVLVASVMGSLHCVGMCGPFALWASGAGTKRRGVVPLMAAYHLGRLGTYLVGSVIAGTAGAMLSAGGNLLGFQSLAARLSGGMMIAIAAYQLWRWIRPRFQSRPNTETGSDLPDDQTPVAAKLPNPGMVAGWLARLRPSINRLPGPARAFSAGALTTLLPCGWLYLFLLVAAGTGGVVSSALVMTSFWLGTLPALTALILGAFRMAPQFRSAMPLLGGIILLITGLYTATGRASADMSSLSRRAESVAAEQAAEPACPLCAAAESNPSATLDALTGEPLPCCVDVESP